MDVKQHSQIHFTEEISLSLLRHNTKEVIIIRKSQKRQKIQ